ncbi:hydrogenase small subunit [Thiomicrospira microaerophila]|uniref:hydrogenase small subunit n=1 Tax=Thiomicrospira microaerophila TaxID=406020 RepID=UPI0005CB3CC3|nr:hydrogenase small subunit [Thiomicrospira microaerophila]
MKIVIIGGGIAADYIANQFLAQDASLEILILSKETYAPYDRIHLCDLVEGTAQLEDITLDLAPQVQLKLDHQVTRIERKAKQVFCGDKSYGYDYLIIASGSEPRTLFDLSQIDNAITFRSADDSFKIAKNLQDRHIVIVGAGPIGLELLDTLVRMPQPKAITLLVIDEALYAPDVDASIVAMMRATYEADPRVNIVFNDQIVDKQLDGRLITRLITKKHQIDDPFVIFGIGIQPNVDFARDALPIGRGILVDRHMRSDDLFIYAVGEAAEINETGFCAGHARDCQQQADVAIAHILKTDPQAQYHRQVAIDGLKVGAFDFIDATSPDYNPKDQANETLLLRANNPPRIDQYILNQDKLVRFFGANTNVDAMAVKRLMESNESVDPAFFYTSRLVSERGRLVCSCVGAYQAELQALIADNAVTDFAELKAYSQAGRVCGRCKNEVVTLIANTEVDPEEVARKKQAQQQAELEKKQQKIQRRLDKFNRFHPDAPLDINEIDQALAAFDKVKDFNGWVSMMTLNLEFPPVYQDLVRQGVYQLNKMPVIWLELSDCSGNSEAFIKTVNPSIDELILKFISLDYHELLMAASGPHSETRLDEIIEQYPGEYLLIVEGAIPLAMEGKYLRIGPKGETGEALLKRVAEKAAAIMAVGSCALDGGVVAAKPNPTGAVGVAEALAREDIINLPGCPVNPINVVGTLLHYLMLGEMPALDSKNRPLWAYAPRVHDNCERRGHYDAGEFVKEWGDEGAKKGWCLFEMGCKGPYADINCSLVKFNENTSWPVQVGHGCIACGQGKRAFDEYANNRKVISMPS